MSTDYPSIYLSPNFLINVLQFLVYRFFTSLVKSIAWHFILFNAIVYGIVFLISHSDSLLLAYSMATDLCVLIFYLASLLNSIILRVF